MSRPLPCSELDLSLVPSPSFVVDLGCLRRNLAVLRDVQERSGAKILLALKGFAMWSTFPLVRESLAGVCASGPWEARLGREKFDREVHVYAPAFTDDDLEETLPLADKISFNSAAQWRRFRRRVKSCGREIECSIRVNPECSTGNVPLYDPCVAGSRLGQIASGITEDDIAGLDGLHFHTLCEQNSDALEQTLEAFSARFGKFMPRLKWLNMGGGHHITRADYDRERLIRLVRTAREQWGVEVYLEPGEAIALGTGVLIGSVVDLTWNALDIAIVDVSASAHMPDTLEMPYRPEIRGAGLPGTLASTARLGGLTCLAGDVIGDYSFAAPLEIGQRLVFEDMAHYTMVKTTFFNGVKHPALCTWDPDTRELNVVRRFRYEDYRDRLS
ncbi:MAG: carboxynorspermidine decarboxylase [Verrucomicrobiales bacterium]|nr:carboxynorspermidine decarboxylase [Verrucomicrobiales bacterium]